MPAAVRAGSGSLYVSISLSRWKILWCWWWGRGKWVKHADYKGMNKRNTDSREANSEKVKWPSHSLLCSQETFQEVSISHNCQTKSRSNVLLSWSYWHKHWAQKRTSPPEISITAAVKHSSNNALLVSAKLMEAAMHLHIHINTHKHADVLQFFIIPLLSKLSASLEFVKGNKGEFKRRDTSRGI